MKKRAATLALIGLLATSFALPAAADAPQQWVMETEQLGINPCTGDPIFLETEVLFSVHDHENTTITHARLLGSIGEQQTQLATLHVVENQNGVRASIREIHEAADGSKFKVTISNVLRVGSEPQFSFEARCIRGPAA